jgi:NADPH:quinone reductase-like Zn-dependent oxidoreductase
VLVVGAGSGVGQAAMQIARLYHARTVVTAGRAEKLERARELGAFEAVNHSTEDVAAAVRKVTNRRGVDVVVEHAGTASWDANVKSLARGGRLVTCGATTGYDARLDCASCSAASCPCSAPTWA